MYALLIASLHAVPAFAQFSGIWGGEEVQVGQRANLFARWEGPDAFDGAFLELPSGWTLQRASAVRPGYRQIPLRVRHLDQVGNVFAASAPQTLRGPYDLIFQVYTGGMPGRVAWTVTPFTRRDDRSGVRVVPHDAHRLTRPGLQVDAVRTADNLVLAFRGSGPPLLLRRAALPDLGTRASHTIEFWMRTTDVAEAVLSTWTGVEYDAYPLELVVDAGGRLRFYRGQPGHHESMATQAPVADGRWHHVALTHDADTGWTRLFLDGLAADSLYSPTLPYLAQRTPLAVGARLASPDAPADGLGGYTGLLDELRLWSQARSQDAIRRTMRQPIRPARGGVLIGFDEPIPQALIEDRPLRIERVASDLVFYYPVRNVQAAPEGAGVRLSWKTADPHTARFVVERSTDGRTFENVGEVRAKALPRSEIGSYTFFDPDIADQVVFYRIRQHFESGSERLSGAIKLGLGEEAAGDVVLVGNFPNPFNPLTTITYAVHEAQSVRVSVWDLSGQQVTVLVDRVHQPGDYQVRFAARDLPSGTYFVRLETREGTQTHKMVLMK